LNALIAEMEALEDQGELFDTLMDLRDDREAARTKLYGSILNILQGRNELLEKIIGCVVDSGGVPELDPKVSDIWRITETKANDLDHLVNYDNDNDIDDLGYESEVYLDEEEEDEHNHSNGNVVKRGITRLSKFHWKYGKPDGIKLNVTLDALNRISWSHKALFLSFLGDLVREHIGLKILSWTKRYFDVDLTFRKLLKCRVPICGMGRGGYALVKEKMVDHGTDAMTVVLGKERGGYARGVGSGVTYKSYFDLLRSRQACDEIILQDVTNIGMVTSILKESVGCTWGQSQSITEDKIKEGTLKVDHGTDALIVVLGKEKGGYARGVGSGVTYKRYFDLPRSRQASNERIAILQSQLDNERRERQEKELEIQNFADEEGETPLSVVGCENDASIQKSNGLATSEKEMETRYSSLALEELSLDHLETKLYD
ncbi:hypothetical protein Tco_1063029, partial [Tanacetum coccineum]